MSPPTSSKGLARKPLSYGCLDAGPLKLGNKLTKQQGQCNVGIGYIFVFPLCNSHDPDVAHLSSYCELFRQKKSKIEGDRASASGWCHVAILLLEPSSWNKFRDLLLLFLLLSSCVGTHSKGKWRGHNFISQGFLLFNSFATRFLPLNP